MSYEQESGEMSLIRREISQDTRVMSCVNIQKQRVRGVNCAV